MSSKNEVYPLEWLCVSVYINSHTGELQVQGTEPVVIHGWLTDLIAYYDEGESGAALDNLQQKLKGARKPNEAKDTSTFNVNK